MNHFISDWQKYRHHSPRKRLNTSRISPTNDKESTSNAWFRSQPSARAESPPPCLASAIHSTQKSESSLESLHKLPWPNVTPNSSGVENQSRNDILTLKEGLNTLASLNLWISAWKHGQNLTIFFFWKENALSSYKFCTKRPWGNLILSCFVLITHYLLFELRTLFFYFRVLMKALTWACI